MRPTHRILWPLLAAVSLAACAAKVPPPAAPTVKQEVAATETGGVRRQAVTIRATVEKVDQKSRKVSLVGYDGTRETLTMAPEVKNLAQVRKGDEVVVTYYDAVAFDVLGKGETRPPATITTGGAAAKKGEMPGGLAADVATLVVEVVRLDPARSTAVVRDPEGEVVTVEIHNPVVFQKVAVGDKVEITMTQAMAIDVRRSPAK